MNKKNSTPIAISFIYQVYAKLVGGDLDFDGILTLPKRIDSIEYYTEVKGLIANRMEVNEHQAKRLSIRSLSLLHVVVK